MAVITGPKEVIVITRKFLPLVPGIFSCRLTLQMEEINTLLIARAVHVVYTRRSLNMERPARSVVEKHEEFMVRRSETKVRIAEK